MTTHRGRSRVAGTTARGAGAVARVLRTIGYAIVAVIVLYIVLALLQANSGNTVYALVRRLAETFDLGLSNLFLVGDPSLDVLLNYGAAALAWLLITAVVVRLVSRLG
jgi:amino acid transporter